MKLDVVGWCVKHLDGAGMTILLLALALVVCLLAPALHAADAETWCGVRVAPERACPSYDSDEWSYPADLDQRYGLRAQRGMGPSYWWSPYDGRRYGSYRDLDIEHIRSRHSASKAGGCVWSERAKRMYATDPLNITLAPPDINRHQKSDKDPDQWMPELNRHWFAWRYLLVSRAYGLTITPETRAALDTALGGRCPP